MDCVSSQSFDFERVISTIVSSQRITRHRYELNADRCSVDACHLPRAVGATKVVRAVVADARRHRDAADRHRALPECGKCVWTADSCVCACALRLYCLTRPAYVLVAEVIETMEHHSKMYGKMSKVWIGPRLFVFVSDPVLVEQILNSPVCLNKGQSYKYIKNIIGYGLITMEGMVGCFGNCRGSWSSHVQRKYIQSCEIAYI